MAEGPTERFFEELATRGHEPLLEKVTASMRFDVAEGRKVSYWRVDVVKGDIAVSRRNAQADCVLRADRSVFDKLASGRANPMASALRGSLTVGGSVELLVLFQRLFPGPRPTTRKPGGREVRQS